MKPIQELLEKSAALHAHLCPRQVLGVRMGMLAGSELGLDLPQTDKRLFAIVETDGCLLSGISAATGCWVERRTLRVEDYGKAAVTFVDTATRQAVRISPNPLARTLASEYAPEATDRWHAMLLGYQRLPDDLILRVEKVRLKLDLDAIISREGHRVSCARCGEEIINQREVLRGGEILCRSCAGNSYYRPSAEACAFPSGIAADLNFDRSGHAIGTLPVQYGLQ